MSEFAQYAFSLSKIIFFVIAVTAGLNIASSTSNRGVAVCYGLTPWYQMNEILCDLRPSTWFNGEKPTFM